MNELKALRIFWILGYLGLVWNIIGVVTFFMTTTASEATLAAMSADQRAFYTEIPLLITWMYALAVSSGALACVLLLMRKAIAVPVFIVSLISITFQMGYSVFFSSLILVQGNTAAILPVLIVIVGTLLVWFSLFEKSKGWLL